MVTFVEGPVTVSVPATSANLGPGYDSLGMAVSMRDEVTGEVVDSGLEITVNGEGEGVVALDESHLVVATMRAAFDRLGGQPPGLRLTCRNVVPHGRGLGSSSAAIVAGLVLARGLVAGGAELMDDRALFHVAADMEGHPDNVAPAFFGGFVVAGNESDEWFAVRSQVDPRISVVAFVPGTVLETHIARGLIPATVPHVEAAYNSGRAALLVAALAEHPEQLFAATHDWLHQQYRAAAMPESLALMHRLRADRVPAVISGAGPTVLAFSYPGEDETAPTGAAALLARCPAGWQAHHLQVEGRGVFVRPEATGASEPG